MIRTLCLWKCLTREDISLLTIRMSVTSPVLVQRLPLNVTHILFGWILSLLFSDFRARWLKSIPRSFSTQMPGQMSIYNWYRDILVLVRYGNVLAHIMFVLCSAADALSSGWRFIVFKILILKDACLTMILYAWSMCHAYRVVQTNGINHNYGISNLHNDFNKQVSINNSTALLIWIIFSFYFLNI